MDIKNLGHVKIALLCKGVSMDPQIRLHLGVTAQEKIYSYSITDWVDRKVTFPSEIKLEDRVYVGFHYRPTSRFRLGLEKECLSILMDEKPIMRASLIKRPQYYEHKSNEGVPLQAIGVSCANHGVSFFINNYCQYFKENEDCKFCTLVPTQQKFNDTLKYKKIQHVDEAMAKILHLEDRVDFIQISGGSLYHHDIEVRNYIPYIQTIKKHLEAHGLYNRVPIHLTTMPPHNLDILKELKNSGLNTISFNLECTNQPYFERYCPGKTKSYGYTGMRMALNTALDVFGKGNVFTIIIAGLEPPEVFVNGVHDLISNGIVPTINIYHHDPLITKMDVGEPDPEVIIGMVNEIANLFREYKVRPGLLGCAHYDIGHEIQKGFF